VHIRKAQQISPDSAGGDPRLVESSSGRMFAALWSFREATESTVDLRRWDFLGIRCFQGWGTYSDVWKVIAAAAWEKTTTHMFYRELLCYEYYDYEDHPDDMDFDIMACTSTIQTLECHIGFFWSVWTVWPAVSRFLFQGFETLHAILWITVEKLQLFIYSLWVKMGDVALRQHQHLVLTVTPDLLRKLHTQ